MKLACLFFLLATYAAAQSDPPSGRWETTIALDGLKIPFTMQLVLDKNPVSGTFVNGDERVTSSNGAFKDGVLRLNFEKSGTTLEAKITNDALKGKYGSYSLEGGVYCTCGSEGEAGPDIAGTWSIAEPAGWRLVVERKGDDTFAHLLRPEDTNGVLTGRFDGLTFMLHHFDGTRASLLELEPRKDGSLDVTLKEPRAAVKKFRASK
jgi:hypothetical protein